jgi:hypothetical protein
MTEAVRTKGTGYRRKAEDRRRKQRLAPGVVVLSLVMILGGLGIAIGAPVATASPAVVPNPCTGHYQHISIGSVQVTETATSATLTWQVSPSGGDGTLNWGNTTAMVFSQNAGTGNTTYTQFLNFLEPSTTYYYEIVASPTQAQQVYPGCYEFGTYSSTFTTSQWPINTLKVEEDGLWVNGTVTSAGGPAWSGLAVKVSCVNSEYTGSYVGYVAGTSGAYSIEVSFPETGSALYCINHEMPIGVGVLNWNFENGAVIWPGVWNETIVTWSPQVVNFVLPENFIGPWIPQLLEFSNAAAGYSYLSFTQSVTFSETQTDSFGASGGAYVYGTGGSLSYQTSTTSSTSYTVSKGWNQNGGSLEVLDRFWTSGTVEYNALTRTWTAPQQTQCNAQCGGEQYQDQGPQYVQSWLYPGSSATGMYTLNNWKNVNISAGGLQPGVITVSGSASTTSTFSMSFGLSVSLRGVLSASLTVSLGSSTSSSTSYTDALNWTISVPLGGPETCFNVFGQGGSASADTATIIGIWAVAPGVGGC